MLDRLVGRYYGQTDIRGAPLAGEEIGDADLGRVDLFSADLRGANLRGANLEDSWLSECELEGASFDWAVMDRARLDNVSFDRSTSFVGVDLNAINFTLAALLQDLAVSQQRIASLEGSHPILAAVLRVTTDYGRSFLRFFAWSTAVILFFGVVYYLAPGSVSVADQSSGPSLL